MEKEKQPENKTPEQTPEVGQFAGIPFGNLIGGPLKATVEAQAALAGTTAEFIRRVGFSETGKEPHKAIVTCKNGRTIEVPLLTIVPIPNLQTDEVNVSFEMEVRKTEQDPPAGKPQNASAAFFSPGNRNFGININTLPHTPDSGPGDNGTKHGPEIKSLDQNTPKGLEKVLQILNESLSSPKPGTQPEKRK